jgi:Mo25-like
VIFPSYSPPWLARGGLAQVRLARETRRIRCRSKTQGQLAQRLRCDVHLADCLSACGSCVHPRDAAIQLAYEACKSDLPLALVSKFALLEFESRKDAAQVVGAIVRLNSSGDAVGVQYVQRNPQMLEMLFAG